MDAKYNILLIGSLHGAKEGILSEKTRKTFRYFRFNVNLKVDEYWVSSHLTFNQNKITLRKPKARSLDESI